MPEPRGGGPAGTPLPDGTPVAPQSLYGRVKAEAEALRDRIGKKEYHPFTGPLNKQDGSAWLAEGQKATDEELSSMNFFVEGISAQIPS